MKSGHISQYIHLSNFKDLKNFNNHFEQHMVDFKASFTKGELIGLKRLARFSVTVPGICNAKIQTLVAACNELGEISRSTFERMLKKAKEFGIVQVINTQKGNGKQGHNVYVFSKYEQGSVPHVALPKVGSEISLSSSNDVPEPVNIDAPIESINLSKTSKIKDNIRNQSLPAEFVSDNVPKDFTKLAGYYFDKAETIEKLWSRVNIAAYKYCFEGNKQLALEVGLTSLKQTVRALKVKKVRDKFGYFYGVLMKKFEVKYFQELTDLGFSLVE
ncbi:hypothetical protein ACIQXQ_20275 [Peribacillus sp. NPDC097198]|uniref:hypothetical protein n=1 Tax=Peribacillus sp. NPDC097198 TaxID=3364397 RepID=UPI00381BDE9F